MIRVCLVAPAHLSGGQAVEARRISDGFADDPEVRVELHPIDPPLPRWLASVPVARTLARQPIYLAGLVRRLLAADVVHVCTAAFGPFLLTTTPAVLLARLLGRPVLVNYRDGRAAGHLRTGWVRWVLRRADALVFPSTFLQGVFREFGLRGEVVPNVVDADRFRFRVRDPLRPVLISARALEALYAVENTILAFGRVRAVHPGARLLVVGGGDQEPRLRALARERGLEGVEFLGAVAHGEVAAWYDRADLFVNSSREDNMPHAVIEAFSSGLPVVTTAAGGIPHVVEHGRNGVLVPVDAPEAMAEAVLALLADPERARALAAEGLRDCRERYTWGAARAQWCRLYARLAGRAPLPAAAGPEASAA